MFKRLGFLLCFLFLAVPGYAAEEPGEAEVASEEDGIIDELKLFSKALSVIDEAYPEEINKRQMLYEAVRGMMDSLDKYSEFIDPDRYELLQIHIRGEYAGIGTMLEVIEDYPVIKGVKPGSAAHKSGLMTGDRILKVNGEETKGRDLVDVSRSMRGEAGEGLILTIYRALQNKTFDIEIVRETIEIDSVRDVRMVGASLGYLWIENWQDRTIAQVDKALVKLQKDGMRALIIDLRNNDGGLLPKAVELSERFLKEGSAIVQVDSKIKEQRENFVASGEHYFGDFPLVILVNENSASASEIFSAAMQDHGRATVVGVVTYGKASVQSVIPFDEQSALKLTTARYQSPKGRDINNIGLKPDILVEKTAEDSPSSDLQILKAVELLKEYM